MRTRAKFRFEEHRGTHEVMVSAEVHARVNLAIDVAYRAGETMVRTPFAALGIEGKSGIEEKSSATDIATAVDRSNEALIVDEIRTRYGDDSVLAEEGTSVDGSGPFTWIVDPLDGTANFVRTLRSSAVSLAIAQHDVIIAGVVFDPYARELFVGISGEGATVNEEPLRASSVETLDRSFVGLSGSNRPAVRELRADLLSTLAMESDSVRDTGSTALSLCWAAAGRFDAHVGLDVAWWDFAAGIVIAREAGCQITGFDGEKDPTPEGFLVCGPQLMNPLIKVLTNTGIVV